MKNLTSFAQLAKEFERASRLMPVAFELSMQKSALLVEAVAKAEIGTYQRVGMSPFPEWEELKDSTKAAHSRAMAAGNAAPDAGVNTPLLVTGQMRADIWHEAAAMGFVVGGDKILEYQELGTPTIPPRPVLSPAIHKSTPEILAIVGSSVEKTLAGQTPDKRSRFWNQAEVKNW